MGLDFDNNDGNTILSEEEIRGLRIAGVMTRNQLDEFEQQNIEEAIQWLINKSFTADKVLNEAFIKSLHKRMYGDVWKWAGRLRTSNTNLGIEWPQISIALRQLLENAKFWIERKTYPADEIAIRFKHQLVAIHCFPNGNGRHSRLMADIIVEKLFQKPVFSWGAASLTKQGELRKQYIRSIKEADNGDITQLIQFARS